MLTKVEPVRNFLDFGGVDLAIACEMSEDRPFFVYSRTKIKERVEYLRATLPKDICLAYSLKANPWGPVVGLLAGLVDGLDVTSKAEMFTALNAGVAAKSIMFAGPGKSEEDLNAAVACGATLCVESHLELARIQKIAAKLGRRANCLIRVNPNFELKKVGMRMGGKAAPFGVDVEDCPSLFAQIDPHLVNFRGVHIYWGSQSLDAEVIASAQQSTVEMIFELAEYFPKQPEIINLGGGFGIPYTPGIQSLDLPVVSEGMQQFMPKLQERFPGSRIFLELGRYLVGEAGLYVCKVVDVKQSRDVKFIITEGGLHHHLAASGNFGQILRRNYPVAIINKADQPATERVDIVGCLCTPLDILATKVEVPTIEVGDLVGVFQSGAYAKSASPTGFLSHPEPNEFLL